MSSTGDYGPRVPKLTVSDAELLWIRTAYELFCSDTKVTEQAIRARIHKRALDNQISRDFEPKAIDQRLILFGTTLTLLGVWHVEQDDELLAKANQVILAIKSLILSEELKETVTADELAAATSLPVAEVAHILHLISPLGQFSAGFSYTQGIPGSVRLRLDHPDVLREYARYDSIVSLLSEFSDRLDPRRSTGHASNGDDSRPDAPTRAERAINRLKNHPVISSVIVAGIVLTAILTFAGKISEVPDTLRKLRGHNGPADGLTISEVSLHGVFEGGQAPANTLDDLEIRWSHDGTDRSLKLSIVLMQDNGRVPRDGVRASDDSARFRAEELKALWPEPALGTLFQIRVEFQEEGKLHPFGPFDVKTGLLIMYYMADSTFVITSSTDGSHLVPHDFEARAVAWRVDARNADDIESCKIRANGGRGIGRFPGGFTPDVTTIECVYLGAYPTELVRYENLGSQ